MEGQIRRAVWLEHGEQRARGIGEGGFKCGSCKAEQSSHQRPKAEAQISHFAGSCLFPYRSLMTFNYVIQLRAMRMSPFPGLLSILDEYHAPGEATGSPFVSILDNCYFQFFYGLEFWVFYPNPSGLSHLNFTFVCTLKCIVCQR